MQIKVESLAYAYPTGVEALRGVSLEISPGERLAIIGQNGAGKTTLVKHFIGLLKPAAGSVLIGDWDTRQHTPAQLASRVGYVFQNPDDQLFQSTVLKEVEFGPRKMGWSQEKVSGQAQAALEMVELGNFAGHHPYDLSSGQRKRVALAAVLAMATEIVILDEPTTGQDYAGVRLIGEIVSELNQRGSTVITITHDIDFCAEHFERVVVMAQGRVLADGPARESLSQAQALVQAAVEPPQLVRLAQRLNLAAIPLNASEFLAACFEGD